MMTDGLDEEDVMLDDHINKCRCCFRIIIDDQKSIRISKSIGQKFYELTQIKVRIFRQENYFLSVKTVLAISVIATIFRKKLNIF